MSEEEKKAIEFLEDIKNSCWTTKYIMSNDCKNCEILLNLIENHQKEIEELKEENNILTSQLNSAFDKGFISKQKIKDKIDELEDIKLCGGDILYAVTNEEIKVLQELLEESE